MTAEPQRTVFQTVHQRIENLAISLRVSGKCFEGEALGVDVDGAGIRYPQGEAPSIPIGATVTVVFDLQVRQPIGLGAKVQSRFEAGEFRTYFVIFENSHQREKLRRFFERRQEHRVEPDPKVSIRVELKHKGAPLAFGQLRDISASGIGVMVSPDSDARISQLQEITAVFQLPRDKKVLEVNMGIRNRKLKDGSLLYGLEFCQHADGQEDWKDHVVDYVVKRERELFMADETTRRRRVALSN